MSINAAAPLNTAIPSFVTSTPFIDPLECCRFCLQQHQEHQDNHNDNHLSSSVATAWRTVTVDQMPHTDIPTLFETCTAIKLDISAGYSELLCPECERQMRTVAQIRTAFVRVARQWKDILMASGDGDGSSWMTAVAKQAATRSENVSGLCRVVDEYDKCT